MMNRRTAAAVFTLAVAASLAGSAAAQTLRNPRFAARTDSARRSEQPQRSHFYPQSSNGAFENQLRKFSDPLGANGAK